MKILVISRLIQFIQALMIQNEEFLHFCKNDKGKVKKELYTFLESIL